jgi:hypothetical protein
MSTIVYLSLKYVSNCFEKLFRIIYTYFSVFVYHTHEIPTIYVLNGEIEMPNKIQNSSHKGISSYQPQALNLISCLSLEFDHLLWLAPKFS